MSELRRNNHDRSGRRSRDCPTTKAGSGVGGDRRYEWNGRSLLPSSVKPGQDIGSRFGGAQSWRPCLIAPIPLRPSGQAFPLAQSASCADSTLFQPTSLFFLALLTSCSASESPASEAYPSTTSPSPHRSSPSTSLGVTYDEVASKQFEAADMSGQGRVSTNSATTTQPFPADGNYGSHHFGQQGGLGGVRSPDMGETWYGESQSPLIRPIAAEHSQQAFLLPA